MKYAFLLISIFLFGKSHAQKTDNIIIITTDGFRWQELFGGMDSALANNPAYHEGDSALIYKKYWAATPEERRKKLLPFFWNIIGAKGQLYGNRHFDNKIDLVNQYKFSYPGYNELLTGFADTLINSNSYPPNPNENVLAFFNKQPKLKNKVAAFGAWNAFDRILNETKSGFPVINGFDKTGGSKPTATEKLLNQMLEDSYKPWGHEECLDVFTHYAAMEWLKTRKPNVLYIAYGETDEWAHAGKYRSYLDAANQVDKWIADLWGYLQTNPIYKNKTTLVIATDHGRGDAKKDEWTSHGKSIIGAEEVWLAVLGPGVKATGEQKSSTQFYQQQIAQTIAALMGYRFTTHHFVAEKIKEVLEK